MGNAKNSNTTANVSLNVNSEPGDPKKIDFSQRQSYLGAIEFDHEGRPLNPNRTPQMSENRGSLYKWGPNHAADPIVIANGKILLIRRKDTGQWALPGGMVDPGEHVSEAALRELREEANMDLGDITGEVIFEGYVNDPRNTQHAWIETTARLFLVSHNIQPQADGEETTDAQWFDCANIESLLAAIQQFDMTQGLPTTPLYASHELIIRNALLKIAKEK